MLQATFINRRALYLRPDPARVIVRPFNPTTEPRDLNPTDKTRANHIVERVLNLDPQAAASQLADVLEVYLLCLLLGFEGRYTGALRAELDNIIEKVKRRIEDIRGDSNKLSPSYELPDELSLPQAAPRESNHFRLAAVAALLFTLILFLILLWHLSAVAGEVRAKLV